MKSAYVVVAVLTALGIRTMFAHGDAPWGVQPLPYANTQIDRAIAVLCDGRVADVNNHKCVEAVRLAFDVSDSFAFDIDETVWVDVDFYDAAPGTQVRLDYDRADTSSGASDTKTLATAQGGRVCACTFKLEHARFADLGFDRTDFMIEGSASTLKICDVRMRRSYATPIARLFGYVDVDVFDANRRPTPARVGIYDLQGRLPLPSADALLLQSLNGLGRVVNFGAGSAIPWPAKNTEIFYVGGHYRARLPVGKYEIVASKGLEYRLKTKEFEIRSNETTQVHLEINHWCDMAQDGWISGDDHIHYALEDEDDIRTLELVTQAEDVKVANVLHMGNVVRTYFPIRDWKSTVNPSSRLFVVVPGQEDPRTARRGHTISLNIRTPVRDPDHYPLYSEIFDLVHAQGGLTGYAHVTDGARSLHAYSGLALDEPFGIIDFAEILSGPFVGTADWFDFLNLGYKLSPSAGTDYLFGLLPGVVRTYVKETGPVSPQAWFDGLKAGHTFVTNGPILRFTANESGIGDEVSMRRGSPLVIKANAALNPDFGKLSSLELVEQGEVVKEVTPSGDGSTVSLDLKTNVTHSTWFVVRANGANQGIVAISAPIYVIVDGQPFWKRAEVPTIVARLKAAMAAMLTSGTSDEGWESQAALARVWSLNEELLKKRVGEANTKLDELVRRVSEPEMDR